MRLVWTIVALLLNAGVMLGLGHHFSAVLTLGLATALALADAGAKNFWLWREGKSMDSLSARLAVVEGESKQLHADLEALRTRNALERIGG